MKITFDITPDELKSFMKGEPGQDSDVEVSVDTDQVTGLINKIGKQVLIDALTKAFDDKVAKSDTVSDSLDYLLDHADEMGSPEMTENLEKAVTFAIHDIYGDDNDDMNQRLAAWIEKNAED